ncbi:LPS export ABC transporter permease LptG [Hydromonas duriensis]|uniref:Lipopolysaccharide export system permease protein n=1 Tax=Hydromonas duriensis TaxID=1527608 RepID=A0A4R6Y8I0_9BURK|nr:LPS export ABC transporter permease LptG [Hydromonas duriensis]TDR31706.1 lipopolysaccharide export system permease protein [Hydromonas duriensis]
MFSLVHRTFYKELLLSILGVLLGFCLLFFTIDALNEVRNLGEADFDIQVLLTVCTLNQPAYIYQLLPICTLIGTVLALSNMAARSELVVWRASGLSLRRLTRIVTGVGVFLAVVLWVVGDMGIALASRTANEIKKEALHEKGFFKDNGGFWSKQNLSDGGFRMINIQSIKNVNHLQDVRLFDLNAQFVLQRIIEAKRALPDEKSGVWQLMDVRLINVSNDIQGQVMLRNERLLDSLKVDLAENNIDVIRNYGQNTINMSIPQLNERINTLKATGQSVRPFEVAYWQKVFYPLSVIVMILLALPFAFMQTRKGGVGVRVVTGIMLGLLFFIMTAASQYIGPLVTWSPIALAVVPSVFFLAVAFLWTRYVTRV